MRQRSNANKLAYNKQRNYYVSLFRKEKNLFQQYQYKKCLDNKRLFWKTVTPLFSDKNKYKETIILTENSNVISDELKVAQTSNNYFANVAASLK